MKKLLTGIALAAALGAAAAGNAFAQDMGNDWNNSDNWSTWDNEMWESDTWGNDDWGAFDSDYDWTATDSDWNDWYGDYADDWETYDDPGDDGWFDI